jgi:hypothetical protein
MLAQSPEFAHAQINGSYLFPYRDSVLQDVLNGPKTPAAAAEKAA